MIKTARKPSTDPAQEKLRNDKAVWNKDVSAFVNDIIHLKKLMNGWPSKFHMERSFIKEPMPADPTTIIGSLLNDYQSIAERGNTIVQEQLNYSKSRKKKQPKQMNLPFQANPATPATPAAPTAPEPDLTQQLALPLAAATQYDLISEGSNIITRFFTRLLTPTMGWSEAARIRKYRMSLLSACAKTYKDLENLQLEIVKSSTDSLNSSNKLLHKAWNDWMLINKGFGIYKLNIPKMESTDVGGEIPPSQDSKEIKAKEQSREQEQATELPEDPDQPIRGDYEHEPQEPNAVSSGPTVVSDSSTTPQFNPSEAIALCKAIVADYNSVLRKNKMDLLASNKAVFLPLHDLVSQFIMTPVLANKIALTTPLITTYKNLVSQLSASNGVTANTLAEVLEFVIQRQKLKIKDDMEAIRREKELLKPKKAETELEVTAQKFLKKWLGRTRHSILSNKTSGMRLDIYKMSEEIRTSIDHIMDLLEKGMEVEKIDALITDVNSQMTKLRGIMRALHLSNPPAPKGKGKGKDTHTPGIWESLV